MKLILHSNFSACATASHNKSGSAISIESDGRKHELRPYADETQSRQAEILLCWILGKNFESELIIKENRTVDSVQAGKCLKDLVQSGNQSKMLRILNADLELIRRYVEETIFETIMDVRSLTMSRKKSTKWGWACMKCNVVFENDKPSWECCKCMLWYHTDCMRIYPRETTREHDYCNDCYTE